MKASLQPAALWNRLRGTFWFVPSLLTLAAIGLATGLVEIDRRFPDAAGWLWWAYGGGPDGARALLSAVAGSTITVVSVTFSVTVVALTVASQHFGPRLLNNFMRDAAAQLVLGAFIATFTYCLVVLRSVQGEGDGHEIFVPHLATTTAVVLTLVSVGALIYYIHHVSVSMQISEIALAVSKDLERAIDRLFPEPIGDGDEALPVKPRPVPSGAVAVPSRDNGYVQVVNGDGIMEVAREHDVVLWVGARPGDFVVEGGCLARVHPRRDGAEGLVSAIQRAFVVGADRTSEQDAGFAVQQLVEVALRALSPGMNELFTAITCIDRLGQGLARMACRQIPDAERSDDRGQVRVISEPYTFPDLLGAAFRPIARAAADDPDVSRRLLQTLAMLARTAARRTDREAIVREADAIVRRVRADNDARPGLEEIHREVRALAGSVPPDVGRPSTTQPLTPTPS